MKGREAFQAIREFRNKRSVWIVTTKPYKGAHFATFPPDLIRPCIRAGAPFGAIILDPFLGSGTTAAVATQLGRSYLGIELNPDQRSGVVARWALGPSPAPRANALRQKNSLSHGRRAGPWRKLRVPGANGVPIRSS